MTILVDTLKGNHNASPPVWMMRQAGRYLPEYLEVRSQAKNFIHFCLSPDLAVPVTLQPIERFDLDAAIIFADILLIPHALGMDVQFIPGQGPVLECFKHPRELEQLGPPENVKTTLKPVSESLKNVRQQLKPNKTLIGFCGGPWTVACYMLDEKPSKDTLVTRQWLYQEPQAFQQLQYRLVEASALYLMDQIEAGANVIQIFESWAGAVPNGQNNQALFEPTLALCKKIKAKYPDIPIIVFPKGLGQSALKDFAQAGEGIFDALGIDHHTDLAWAGQNIPETMGLQGNLDPAILLTTPEIVAQHTKEMLAKIAGRPRYIANLGHGITPKTPIENVASFIQTIRSCTMLGAS